MENIGIRVSYEPMFKSKDIIFRSPNANSYQTLIDLASKFIIIRRKTDGSIEGFIEFAKPKLLYILYKIEDVIWYHRTSSVVEVIQYFSVGDYISIRKPNISISKNEIIHDKRYMLTNNLEKDFKILVKQVQDERKDKQELKLKLQEKENELLEYKAIVSARLDELKSQMDYEILTLRRELL